jgi:uncharacterized membrane protein
MTREAFLARLWDGLKGLSPKTAAEIVADYQAHFTEGEAAGRSDDDIAAALGDPDRLARELRAEAGLKRWESERNPSAAAAAVFAVLGLGAIDLLILLPMLIGVVCTMFGIAIACIALMIGGAVVFAAGPFSHPPGGPAVALLGGLGLMAGAVSASAILTLVSIGLTNALVWYGRLHFRLLKPAIDPQPWATTEPARP